MKINMITNNKKKITQDTKNMKTSTKITKKPLKR